MKHSLTLSIMFKGEWIDADVEYRFSKGQSNNDYNQPNDPDEAYDLEVFYCNDNITTYINDQEVYELIYERHYD